MARTKLDEIDFALSAHFGTAYTLLPMRRKQALCLDVDDIMSAEGYTYALNAVNVLAGRIGWREGNEGVVARYAACLPSEV